MTGIPRREFLRTGSAIGAASIAMVGSASKAEEPEGDRPVVVGVMGLSRGRALARTFANQPNVSVKYVCDADLQRATACAAAMRETPSPNAKAIQDFRQILDDPEVDALVCAAPNHWHAPATIFACQAGKHVYVEKPCSHNPWEGEAMVKAARSARRVVQLGTQRRSSPGTQQAITQLHAGKIGRVYLARAWYSSARGSIGHGKPAAIPQDLDYALWQGPAPARDYLDNVVHYNWHWRWHWGNGELGNNGIHTLDLCRWGLQVTHPVHVTSVGGRYAFEDDQETPDTHTVGFSFDSDQTITWHGLSCNRHDSGFVTFYGTDGTLELEPNGTYRIYNSSDEKIDEQLGNNSGESAHVANFLAAIRKESPDSLNAEILEGHRSTLLCHLGNIAHRTGRALHCDPARGDILDDAEAMQYWRREYAPEWEPKV